jgi:hypothetical protein
MVGPPRSAEKFLATYIDPRFEQYILEAKLYRFKSWLRMDKPGAIKEILAFANYHQPGIVAQQAIMLVGEDAFDKREFDDAIKYLEMVDPSVVSTDEQSARAFKLGYSWFIRKEFDQACCLFR